MVGILLSYWGGLFSGATLVSGRVYIYIFFLGGEKKGKVLGLLAEVVIVLAVQTL